MSHFLGIIENGAFAVKRAIELRADDFEDAVQYYAVWQADADYIITRNKKNFSFSDIKVLTPKEYMLLKHIF